jgi:hypothetical protein
VIADDISAKSREICEGEKDVKPLTGMHEPIQEPKVEMMAEEEKIDMQKLDVRSRTYQQLR